jgi:DNA-binding transcriptional ArsR family regulator
MGSNSKQDYIAKHRKIRDKLIEKSRTSEHACFDVVQLASELKMDIRTVRAHLKIMEVDAIGVFIDAGQKQFCTKDGIALLANMLRVHEKSTE